MEHLESVGLKTWIIRWEGGIGMGNTCKSMADSFQCMTKPTTIKKKKNLDYLLLSCVDVGFLTSLSLHFNIYKREITKLAHQFSVRRKWLENYVASNNSSAIGITVILVYAWIQGLAWLAKGHIACGWCCQTKYGMSFQIECQINDKWVFSISVSQLSLWTYLYQNFIDRFLISQFNEASWVFICWIWQPCPWWMSLWFKSMFSNLQIPYSSPRSGEGGRTQKQEWGPGSSWAYKGNDIKRK